MQNRSLSNALACTLVICDHPSLLSGSSFPNRKAPEPPRTASKQCFS